MASYNTTEITNLGFNTRAIHAGQEVDADTASRNQPIYLTSSYVFHSAEHAAARFSLSDAGPIYSRLTNPTTEALENRIASLEGGTAAVAFGSGQAAETAALLTIAGQGDHIVASPRLYGGTETLLVHTLGRLGITVSFVENPDDPASWAAAVTPQTKAFYGETFANPLADVLDIPAVAQVAHAHKVPLIVDNTVATAALVRPLELGADIVVASLTKFYTGNGSAVGGIVVDGGTFDWAVEENGQPKFPGFTEPDAAYHGLRFAELGNVAFAVKARAGLLRDTGATLSAFNAWVTLQGLDTLGLRLERHNHNASEVAQFLAAQNQVTRVNYAGLETSPWFAVKQKLGLKYTGSVLSFDVRGGKQAAWTFIDALRLHSNVANIGDVRSLVIHPASTTHSQSDAAALQQAGICAATVRLSVGIEDIADILADLQRGFDALTAAGY